MSNEIGDISALLNDTYSMTLDHVWLKNRIQREAMIIAIVIALAVMLGIARVFYPAQSILRYGFSVFSSTAVALLIGEHLIGQGEPTLAGAIVTFMVAMAVVRLQAWWESRKIQKLKMRAASEDAI